MAEFIECPNCGYVLNKEDKVCKYCGTKNPNFVEKTSPIVQQLTQTVNTIQTSTTGTDSKISIPVLVLLLIFCWPVAIIYLVLKSAK